MHAGTVNDILSLMASTDLEVQAQAAGIVTNLSTLPELKRVLGTLPGALTSLGKLLMSPDVRVLHNAAGAMFNFTHVEELRRLIVLEGLVPSIVSLMSHRDPDVQFYAVAAISNLAIEKQHRLVLMQDVGSLLSLLRGTTSSVVSLYSQYASLPAASNDKSLINSHDVRLLLQVCLALRNLSCDEEPRNQIVKLGALKPLCVLALSFGSSSTTLSQTEADVDWAVPDKCACTDMATVWPSNRKGFIVYHRNMMTVTKLRTNLDLEIRTSALNLIRNLCYQADPSTGILESGVLETLACCCWEWKENNLDLLVCSRMFHDHV